MADLKTLRVRIKSVKSTQKITKAMKMVAASKLRRAQARAEEARPYSERMERMLVSLASRMPVENAPALLSGRRDELGNLKNDSVLLVVATSDRGLCGGFNSSIVKAARLQIRKLTAEGKKVGILTIGKKGLEQLRYSFENLLVGHVDTTQTKQPEYAQAEDVAQKMTELFANGSFDSCVIIYNKFISVLTQEVKVQQLIPLDVKALGASGDTAAGAAGAVYEYEPDEVSILSALLPRNVSVQVFHALLENAASVQAARMTAMDNATRNAQDMIKRLSLEYNRSRQAKITTELIEIISGAQAL